MEDPDLINNKIQVDDLTWREQEVLELLANRMTNREIAHRLNLAESTVKDYVGKILSKLYVNNRRKAVERAKMLGFLDTQGAVTSEPRTNLPSEGTPFIGRSNELGIIKSVLVKSRLVTLTGPGGIGKTRLALKVAEELAEEFKDGTFFVSLAAIAAIEDIVQAISESINFPIATPEQPQSQLIRYLANRQLLLVMDNYEHLLDGVDIVSEILQAAAGVKILTTSQEKLSLLRETIINLGGMNIANPDNSFGKAKSDAFSLFIQSAKKNSPEYAPSDDQIDQINNICKIVDGLPLAIEMAASWLHVLSEGEIAGELEKGIDILETEARDVPGRQRSIHAVFDHSWSLLNRSEQELFTCFSVFRGGFTREAAQEVAGATLKQLAILTNKSFISHNQASGRYEIHGLLRQYAQEKLDVTPQSRDSAQEAHAAYFGNFMNSSWPQLRSNHQLSALKDIQADLANIRAAWEYRVLQADAEQMRMFMYSFWFIYLVHGWNHAAVDLFGDAVNTLSDQTSDQESLAVSALAMGLQGYFLAWLGLSEQGYAISLESEKILDKLERPLDRAKVLDGLSLNSYYLSYLEDEERAMRTIHTIARDHDNDSLLAYSYFLMSLIDLRKKEYIEGIKHAKTSLTLYENIGDTFSSSWPLLSLGGLFMAEQEFEEAAGYYRQSLKISEKFGYQWLMENSSKYLGKIALSLNDIEGAEYYLNQSLVIALETGLGREKANLLYEFAVLRLEQNRKEQAVELLSLILKLPESSLARVEGGKIQDKCELLLAQLENDLKQDAYSTSIEKGRELELDEAILNLIARKS